MTNQVPIVLVGGQLQQLPSGDTLAMAGMTAGSVVFIGASGELTQDNANFFYSDSLNRFSLGTNNPQTQFHVKVPSDGVDAFRFDNAASGIVVTITVTSAGHGRIAARNGSGTIQSQITGATASGDVNYMLASLVIGGTSAPTTTNNLVMSGGATSPTLGAATADITSLAGIDRVNTRHAAAGNRVLGIRPEQGSAIYIGDDAIDFAAATAIISVNSTDITLTSTTIDFPQKFTKYNNIATVANGVPSEIAQINTTGLTGNVSIATLYAVPASGAGMYRVSVFAVETVAGSISSTLPRTEITFTDVDANTSITINATATSTANTVGTANQGQVVMNVKASTNIQYATTGYASNAAGMTYAIHIRLEALG